ncbi:MAG: 1,4-alpha-glucan branching protein GlgB [Erysipelotrichaceae bacterium]|jgi:1,4-alpha-glucan branching enzyme|nr:1,4-alpha-glucan branching protein GlgB [Erysipelotrichaceae bacterium]
MLDERELEHFFYGHSLHAYRIFGAHFTYEGGNGVRFTVYAPNARSVQVIGNFNNWDGGNAWMERTGRFGLWSLFVPNVKEWDMYKYKIQDANGSWIEKTDPYGFYSELRPGSASKVVNLQQFDWQDSLWLASRAKSNDQPVNIYELHSGSWKRHADGSYYTYSQLANELIPYCKEMGFTHIELMPLTEHPFDGSWGYQSHGYFSATSRYGSPAQLMDLINQCHLASIGVILDFVPVHFVKDEFGLRRFDGTCLYEYSDPANGESQWGTCNFDLWREDVRSFLMSSASFWMDLYHIDGLRVDAVSNLIFWQGDKTRGVNEGALNFIKRLNANLHKEYPNCLMIAEDSSDFPAITASTLDGGLGFDYKWDLGWMNDTLKYFSKDPLYRSYHHNLLTFSMAYFYAEKFVLPLSHDEVVHGKGTILNKMFGTYEQKFAQAKTLYLYQYTHPGKKLNFMGNELGLFSEFSEERSLEWDILSFPIHDAFHRYFRDLSLIYRHHSALSRYDFEFKGFSWIDADNARQSIYAYYREDERSILVVVLNMTPASYEDFRLGVPWGGSYVEVLNTEKDIYNGCNMCNYYPLEAEQVPAHRFGVSIRIRIAPFAGILFERKK